MKIHLPLLLLPGLALSLAAGPMQPEQIPASAKWAAHLDVAAIRNSESGHFLIEEIVKKRLPRNEGPIQLDAGAAIALADSITLFGSTLAVQPDAPEFDGVMVLTGQDGLLDMVNGLVSYAQLEGMVTELQAEPYQLLQGPEGILGAILPGGQVVVSRNRAAIEDYLAVLAGKQPNLLRADGFQRFAGVGSGFAVVAMVDGIDQLPEMGPQARILKLSQGVMLKLGETDGDLALTVSLRTDSESTARTLRQIVQGALAMARLAAVDEVDLPALLDSAEVKEEGPLVNLSLRYAAAKLIELVASQLPPIEIANDAVGGEAVTLKVIRSSADATNRAAHVLDGDAATRWLTDEHSATLTVQLPETIRLDSMGLDWTQSVGHRFAFRVEGTTDGATWTERFAWDGDGAPPAAIAFVPADARLVRVRFDQEGAEQLGLRDLRINGRVPLRASAFATTDVARLPENLFDNDAETRFVALTAPVVVEARIRDLTEVREIGFLWDLSGRKEVVVSASADGVEWERILAVAADYPAGEFVRLNAADTAARFLKFESPQTATWGAPREIRVYGLVR